VTRQVDKRERGSNYRGSEQYYPADVVAWFLFHVHGIEPTLAEDFRLSEHAEWPSRWGRHTITKNGDPTNAATLGDTDGRALEFTDDTGEHLDAGDVSALDVGADESLSVFALLQTQDTTEPGRFVTKRDLSASNEGWSLTKNNNGQVNFAVDDGTNTDTANGTTAIDDGSPHVVGGTRDPGASEIRAITDGTVEATANDSSGNLSNAAAAKIAIRDDLISPYIGDLGLVGAHKQWLSEPQAAYLDEILRVDRTKFAERLHRWLDGTPRDGLQRRLPGDLQDGYLSSTDYLWMPERTIHLTDGMSDSQLTDYSGSNFITQRTASDQITARGPSSLGEPLDHIECSASTVYTSDKFPNTPSAVTVFFVYQDRQGSNNSALFAHRPNSADDSFAMFSRPGGDRVQANLSDSDGGFSNIFVTNIDPQGRVTVTAVRWQGLQTASPSFKVWADDGSGIDTASGRNSNGSNFSQQTETFFAIQPNGLLSEAKDVYFVRRIDAAPTDSEITSMLNTLSSRYPVGEDRTP